MTIPEKGRVYWFVVLRGGMDAQYPVPMTDGGDGALDEEIALYRLRDEAVEAAESNPVGMARGYEVYEWQA